MRFNSKEDFEMCKLWFFFVSLAPRRRRPISWTSTPELDENDKTEYNGEVVTAEISVSLPRRRHTAIIPDPEPTTQVEESYTLKKPPRPPSTKESDDLTINRNDSLAERVRKMQLLKKQNSIERELRRQSSSEKWDNVTNRFVIALNENENWIRRNKKSKKKNE